MYHQKYIKYKTKYENLKRNLKGNLRGGDTSSSTSSSFHMNGGGFTRFMPVVPSPFRGNMPDSKSKPLLVKTEELADVTNVGDLKKFIYSKTASHSQIVGINTLGSRGVYLKNDEPLSFENGKLMYKGKPAMGIMYEKFDHEQKKCSVPEMMNMTKQQSMGCPNRKLLDGSCSHPSFWESQSDGCNIDWWGEFIGKLYESYSEEGVEKPLGIEFVLGPLEKSISPIYSSHPLGNKEPRKILKIYMNPYFRRDEVYDIKGNVIILKRGFPLSAVGESNKKCLGFMVDLNKIAPVHITNKICGACFSSFFTLLHGKQITYSVSPEQGLNENDTREWTRRGTSVKNCFTVSK